MKLSIDSFYILVSITTKDNLLLNQNIQIARNVHFIFIYISVGYIYNAQFSFIQIMLL